MKKNNSFKITWINTTEDDLNNSFVLYVLGIMELITFALVQGEFNFISTSCLVACAVLLCIIMYRKGINDAYKEVDHYDK